MASICFLTSAVNCFFARVLSSSLAAYIHAKETGEGQSIDMAQFEAIHAILAAG